jgi:hypothetical protein
MGAEKEEERRGKATSDHQLSGRSHKQNIKLTEGQIMIGNTM